MATTFTASYAIGKPGKGDTGWWSVLNASMDTIDTALAGIQNQINTTLNVGVLHVSGPTTQNVQGAWMAWNRSSAVGETDFVCHSGSGGGGFYFYVTQDNANFKLIGRFQGDMADGETALVVMKNNGGSLVEQRVRVGAPDSGGAGFRMLRVFN